LRNRLSPAEVGYPKEFDPVKAGPLKELDVFEVSSIVECRSAEVGIPGKGNITEVSSPWKDEIYEIIPILPLAMLSESFSEGMGILCGVCGVQDTQTIRWITLNIPTAEVIMFALGTGVFLVRHYSHLPLGLLLLRIRAYMLTKRALLCAWEEALLRQHQGQGIIRREFGQQ